MKITILVIGSRGDIQPLIALGLGLKQAGYKVKIATNELFKVKKHYPEQLKQLSKVKKYSLDLKRLERR